MNDDEKNAVEEFLHRRMMEHRPEKVLVYHPTEKPKWLKLRVGQKRYHMAAREIAKMDWRRVELYEERGALIHGINIEELETDDDVFGSVHEEHMHLLNLLSLNNHRQAKLYSEMFRDVLEHYKELAANSVDRAIGAERAWIKAIQEIQEISAPANGESPIDQFFAKAMPKLLDRFEAGGGDLDAMKKQIENLQRRADALKAKRGKA